LVIVLKNKTPNIIAATEILEEKIPINGYIMNLNYFLRVQSDSGHIFQEIPKFGAIV
jgi:hypothetical protein